MLLPNQNSTKEEIIFYVADKGERLLRKFGKAVSKNPLSKVVVDKCAGSEELMAHLTLNPKTVLWREAVKLCPELESGYDDDDEEYEDDDDDEDDEGPGYEFDEEEDVLQD